VTAYLVTYLLFSVIYWAVGDTDPWGHPYIYPPLDYRHPAVVAALVVGVVVVVLPVVCLLLWRWHKLWGAVLEGGRQQEQDLGYFGIQDDAPGVPGGHRA
jgi:hypothetical protein